MINIVINTKGGVGKSTVSSQFLSAYIYSKTNKRVEFYEVDDQNESIKSMSKSDFLNSNLIKTENLGKFAEESILFEDDVIVDVGGNITAIMFLQKLKNLGGFISPTVYFIPMLDGDQDAKNAADTFRLIREFDKESKIVYVLNRCTNSSNQELMEREFIDFFGSDILDVDETPKDDNSSYIAINKNSIYNVVGKLQKTILEIALDSHDEEYKKAAIEFFADKSNPELYKKTRRLMFLKEQSTIAKGILENEYYGLFDKLDEIIKKQ